MTVRRMVLKFITHSKHVLQIAMSRGWRIGARYTNLRDVRQFRNVEFIDIDWKNYDFDKHYYAVKTSRPILTVARDIEHSCDFDEIMREAEMLERHSRYVIVVPKDISLSNIMENSIPSKYIFGYSTPTKYGGTKIDLEHFKRPVHILGGRPDIQRRIGSRINVFSFDCNRFTYDAKYGDYFNGVRFVPHPVGGYDLCLRDSISNIDGIWDGYESTHINANIVEKTDNNFCIQHKVDGLSEIIA
jgi:hypothetical protein